MNIDDLELMHSPLTHDIFIAAPDRRCRTNGKYKIAAQKKKVTNAFWNLCGQWLVAHGPMKITNKDGRKFQILIKDVTEEEKEICKNCDIAPQELVGTSTR